MTRANPFRALPVLVAFLMNLVIGPLTAMAQVAPVVALTGSSFESGIVHVVSATSPGLNISKLADDGAIDAGELAGYTVVVWNAGPGAMLNASWSDELPSGVNWSVDLTNADGDDACASSIDSDGHQSASCTFGDLGVSLAADGKVIHVSGETDRDDCGELHNTAFALADNAETVQASASITVTCPAVALEKVSEQPDPVLPVPDTALVVGPNGELMVLLVFGWMGTLVVANVRAVRRRR